MIAAVGRLWRKLIGKRESVLEPAEIIHWPDSTSLTPIGSVIHGLGFVDLRNARPVLTAEGWRKRNHAAEEALELAGDAFAAAVISALLEEV